MIDGIYIHIPFCKKKCAYCDFLAFQGQEFQISKYIEYLKKEISLYDSYEYDTVYFGGGTPSLLQIEELGGVLKELKVKEDAEVTIEINPTTVDFEKLKKMREIGINRISIGVQSFNNEHLKVLGRLHDSARAVKCYEDARKAGFTNISLDLMFALPNETKEELRDDLVKLIKLNPEHISIYSLIWEEGTKFFKLLQEGKLQEVDNDLEGEMYEFVIDSLVEAGYTQYEISSFSKKGFESRHNSKYWKSVEYLGVGMGASGFKDRKRYKNVTSFKDYYEFLDENRFPIGEIDEIDDDEFRRFNYILSLRMLKEWTEPKEKEFKKIFDELFEKGMLEKNNEEKFRLSKKGIFLANDVFEVFLD